MKHLNGEYIGRFEAQLALEWQFDQVLQAHILFQHLAPLEYYHLQEDMVCNNNVGFIFQFHIYLPVLIWLIIRFLTGNHNRYNIGIM